MLVRLVSSFPQFDPLVPAIINMYVMDFIQLSTGECMWTYITLESVHSTHFTLFINLSTLYVCTYIQTYIIFIAGYMGLLCLTRD